MPEATGWTKSTVFEVIAAGAVVATKTLDESTSGDAWHAIATVVLKAVDPPPGAHPQRRLRRAGGRRLAAGISGALERRQPGHQRYLEFPGRCR